MFTVDLLQDNEARSAATGIAPGQPINPGLPVLTRMEWIGQPFRPFLETGMPTPGAEPNQPVGAGGSNPPRGSKPTTGVATDESGRPIS